MKKPNPSAFLHTMHMDLGQKHRVPAITDANPFGRQGRDYDPTYSVTCDPLYTAGQLLEIVQALEPIVSPFIDLPYGTKFIYEPGAPDVWVKIGHNLIAAWGTSARLQSLCCFSHEIEGLSASVWVVDSSVDAKAKATAIEALDDEPVYHFETGAYEVELGPERWAKVHAVCDRYKLNEDMGGGDINGLVSEILIELGLARGDHL